MSSSTFTWHVSLTKVFLQLAGNRHVYESKLKLDDRGRLFPEGLEKNIYHDEKVDQIKKAPTTKRGGRTYPKARTLYRSRAPARRGEERRKESGTAEGSESRR
ncbi:hypothetical protein TNCV_1652811 [Trichonephila clavipes]|nr:hypothetical protein TNCV_1652811 [Trichonephila clavipes]